ncbi:MAG: hypothetical protein ABWZ58_03135 [Acidimicrobiia bacterium]
MITEEHAMKLLTEANPVLDLSTIDSSGDLPTTRLADLDTRSSEMTKLTTDGSATRPTSDRRRLILGAVAVVAILVAGAVFFEATNRAPVSVTGSPVETTIEVTGQTDAVQGFLGLPPTGAIPSTPENGELVASMWEHISGRGTFGNGWLYVYADGRLIWQQADPEYPVPTGWLERRLTPEGVQLIHSEIIATGLFDPDQPTDPFPSPGGYVEVRHGDQLVYVWGAQELRRRLSDLWSWLPQSAWEDTEARAYVPSRYAVCIYSNRFATATEPTKHLSELPATAQEMLSGAAKVSMDELLTLDPAAFAFTPGDAADGEYCSIITTEEARSLARTFDDAGWEKDAFGVVQYTTSERVVLTFWPMLPHGVPGFTGA